MDDANSSKVICPEAWSNLFISGKPYAGCTDSLETALTVIRQYEIESTSSFVHTRTKKNNFGLSESSNLKNHYIMFKLKNMKDENEVLEFDGRPFLIANSMLLKCHRGLQTSKNSAKMDQDHDYCVKKNKVVQHTKKVNCPAEIVLKEIIIFPDFKVDEESEWKKRSASKQLRLLLIENPDAVKIERRIYVCLPKYEDHRGHDCKIAEEYIQRTDARLLVKVKHLVSAGVTNTKDVAHYLEQFVADNRHSWFRDGVLPSKLNRRFYPSHDTIRVHVNNRINELRHCTDDQENLLEKIKEWREKYPDDNIFFRPYQHLANSEMKEKFLFVFQSKQQQYLLKRYGMDICLLDATYKTMKYALPCFLLCVKTNVHYHPVAVFITLDEISGSISEALQIIKDWNPGFNPKYFVTDFSEAEINSIERIFPHSLTYICDFHREQAWIRWLSLKNNGVYQEKNEILSIFRSIAAAKSNLEFEEKLDELRSSSFYKNSKSLQNYFNKTWYPEHQRWVSAFRPLDMPIKINTTNGVESLNKTLKRHNLDKFKDKSLSNIVSVITEIFLPSMFEKYVKLNVESSSMYKQHNADVCPEFLKNRPKSFVTSCINRIEKSKFFESRHIQKVSQNKFKIISESCPSKTYDIFLGSDSELPFCTCYDWARYKIPCKHIFAVFSHTDAEWQDLHPRYRDSVFYTLDNNVVTNTYNNSDEVGNFNLPLSLENNVPAANFGDETSYEENAACLVDVNLSTIDDIYPPICPNVDFTAIDNNLSNNQYNLDAIASTSSSNIYPDVNLNVANTSTIISSNVNSNATNNNLSSNPQTAKYCREILKELTSATYLINDHTVMSTFHSKLLDIKSYVDTSLYKEDLPPLKENQKKRKSCDGSLIKLPEKKKKKKQSKNILFQ